MRSTRYQQGPELRHLYTFLAVAERLSFRGAAEALRVAQPAVSRTIRELEAQLGAELFARDRGGVRLTGAGEYLLHGLPERLRALGALLEGARSRAIESRELRLGYSPAASDAYVKPWLARRATDRRIVLREGRSSELVEAVRAGSLDACIALLRPEDERGLLVSELGAERLGVCLPEAHALSTGEEIEISSLSTCPLILFDRSLNPSLYDGFVAACAKSGFTPRVAHEVSPRSTAVMLVLAGEGIATLTESLAPLAVEGTRWRPLHPIHWVKTYAVERRDAETALSFELAQRLP